MTGQGLALAVILLVGVIAAVTGPRSAWAADPTFPALSGRVVDQAQILLPNTEAELTGKLAALEAETGDQFVVVTLDSLQGLEIEDYGYRLGRAWGIGSAANDNGVLLIVAPNDRKVRLEVGYGLEPVLTDALSNQIIQTEILPPFREGGYARGIGAGVDAVMTQLRLDPAEAQARAAAAAPTPAEAPLIPGLIVALIFLFLFLSLLRGLGRKGRLSGRGIDPVLVWGAAEILSHAVRGRSGGGSGFGGGGFSGGGGSFGGGGASGGW